LVARLLPGWKTLLHTLPPRGGVAEDGVTGVVGVVGIDLLPSPVASATPPKIHENQPSVEEKRTEHRMNSHYSYASSSSYFLRSSY
jgi:hypothetical protein